MVRCRPVLMRDAPWNQYEISGCQFIRFIPNSDRTDSLMAINQNVLICALWPGTVMIAGLGIIADIGEIEMADDAVGGTELRQDTAGNDDHLLT